MSITIDGSAGITFPDTVQQTNAVTMTGGVPPYYAARAWVTFDGSTTPPSILSSANVASVLRTSTGLFTITFTSNMPNANYAVAGMAFDLNLSVVVSIRSGTPTVSSFDIRVTGLSASSGSASTSPLSSDYISLVVFA
jgi:hypothetical protein